VGEVACCYVVVVIEDCKPYRRCGGHCKLNWVCRRREEKLGTWNEGRLTES